MMIPFLQKQHMKRFDGWRICGNDRFKLMTQNILDTSMDMIFARSSDLADQYLCQFIHGIFSVSPSPRNFLPFLQAPPPHTHTHTHPSVLSSSCKPVTAQLTLQWQNKQWQKTEKNLIKMSRIDIPNTFSFNELYLIIVQLILNKERFLDFWSQFLKVSTSG